MILLSDYIYREEDLGKIQFDKYGRPYLQHENGRIMLSRKSDYQYSITN